MIVVGGGELVARELAAREHHPAAETTAAPSRSRSDRRRTWSTKQLLRVIKMDRVDLDRHPCSRKQVRIVRFARREHGWAQGGRRCKRAAAGETFEVGFEGGPHLSGETVKLRCFTRSCEKMPTENSICVSSLGSSVGPRIHRDLPWRVGTGERTAGFRRPYLLRIDQTWTKSDLKCLPSWRNPARHPTSPCGTTSASSTVEMRLRRV